MILDEVMPRYDFHEVHSTVIRARPETVLAAVWAVTLPEMRPVGTLFALRALPNRLLRGDHPLRAVPADSLLQAALRRGFILLGEAPGRELVVGTAGTFWSLRSGATVRLASAREFLDLAAPGQAKAAMNFSLEPLSDGRTRLRTETRILATDPEARRKFARYWWVIHAGSALIRRRWLRAVRRRAEASP